MSSIAIHRVFPFNEVVPATVVLFSRSREIPKSEIIGVPFVNEDIVLSEINYIANFLDSVGTYPF